MFATLTEPIVKAITSVTGFLATVKEKLPGYRHTVIGVATLVVGAVGTVAGVESDLYKALVGLAGLLGVFIVKNDPLKKKRAR